MSTASVLSQNAFLIFPILAGVLSHHLYFIHGEHHKRAFRYFCVVFIVPIVSVCFLASFTQRSLLQSAALIVKCESQFLAGLFGSIFVYRVSPAHRLSKFSGPLAWRLTKLAHTFSNGRTDFRGYRTLHALHERYGDIVRTGPSEVSIIDADAVQAVLGARSSCKRAAWYAMADPLKAVFHTRDRTEHDARKRIWEQGMSKSSLQAYEKRIQQQIGLLTSRISEKIRQGQTINASVWFNYLTFDVMGSVGFSKSFGMLEQGTKLEALKILENGQMGLGMFGCVPWLFMCLTRLPWIAKEHNVFVKWCEDVMMDRVQRRAQEIDIANGLVQAATKSSDPGDAHQWLTGDSRILIVAGSDAVASSLTFAFYYLAEDPSRVALLRSELEAIGNLDASALQTRAPYLNAFITEVLRMWPPNPSGVLRQTPKEGVQIGKTYIPSDVTVCVPFWALHRSPGCFIKPDSFIPERWTTRPDLILRKDAYVPFGSGAYACIGKQLALMEMRLGISRLIMHFDIKFGAGEDGRALLEESKDWFTWGLADLKLDFVHRHESPRV